jgi:hypothetical protein
MDRSGWRAASHSRKNASPNARAPRFAVRRTASAVAPSPRGKPGREIVTNRKKASTSPSKIRSATSDATDAPMLIPSVRDRE